METNYRSKDKTTKGLVAKESIKTHKILIVDDEEDYRKIIRAELESVNLRVIEAKDGSEALQILEMTPEPIAIVIMDMVMPKMDGIETLFKIKENEDDYDTIECNFFPDKTIRHFDLRKSTGWRMGADFLEIIKKQKNIGIKRLTKGKTPNSNLYLRAIDTG